MSSRLGLGTHALHRLLSARARGLLLATAYELGVRYFDSSPAYGGGLAEREVGRLAVGHRSELVVTTKFGIAPGRLASALPGAAWVQALAGAGLRAAGLRAKPAALPHRDYGAHAMIQSVEGSLRRLRTETIDILYLHAPTLETVGNPEPLLSALDALRRTGKIRHVGLSGDASHCRTIAERHPALAEVLQIEVPRHPAGLPIVSPPVRARAGVGFWECQYGSRPEPEALIERLRRAVPTGVILLSTCQLSTLSRAAAALAVLERDPPLADA